MFFVLFYFIYLVKGSVIHKQTQYSKFMIQMLHHTVAIQIQGSVM